MTSEVRVVAVTASRHGPTGAQKLALTALLASCEAQSLVHGDCIGGDDFAAREAKRLGYYVIARPWAKAGRWRAYAPSDKVYLAEADPLARNHKIVKDGDLLVAMPKEGREPKPARGQGTWSTVRYARMVGKPRTIIWPSGRVTHEGGE